MRDTVIISDNTIYYARILGDFSDTLYVRVHVRIVPGLVFPDRAVEIQISLQRVPGVLFARLPEEEVFGRREFQNADFEQIHNS